MENRQEMSVYVRSYAVNQFHKQFHIASKNNEQQKILQNLNTVSEIYRPHRYFKRKNAPPPDVNSRVQITLLEYGHKGGETHSAANNSECEETIVKNEQMDQVIFLALPKYSELPMVMDCFIHAVRAFYSFSLKQNLNNCYLY